MNIAISANGKELNVSLDPRFGRCPFFAIYNEEEKKWSFLPNPGALEGSGAGVKAAQFLGEHKVDVLLTGDIGPNASRILHSLGTEVYSLKEVPLEEALKQYKRGQLQPVKEATVAAHSGISSPDTENDKQIEPESKSFKIKVAIATDGPMVAQHFGRCPAYTVFDVNNGTTINRTVVANPGHEPGFLPRFLGEKGVNCVIAGGMGPRAQNIFAEQGIRTVIGVTGTVEEVILSYLAGNLAGGESLCEHGEHDHVHECGHEK